jgi:hypothetical protein
MWQSARMKLNIRRGYAIGFMGLCAFWPHDASAWGNLGHRITGTVAESLLTAAARRQVHVLLGEESLAVAATHMDTQRASLGKRWPAADQWHYDNQPVCGNTTPCPQGNCATRKIEEFRKLLADRRAGNVERATALRVLIHLLGDIHQPLHMADNADRGGNNLYVKMSDTGERYRLHELLDTILVKELIAPQRTRDYAMSLTRRYQSQLEDWQRGKISDWAQQSHELAVTHTYGSLPGFACNRRSGHTIVLTNAYLQDVRRYLPEQLTKAGVRIAAVLNATLK